MGNSKVKKALKALKQRIETIEMNADMIERAVGRETTEETIKCKDEIKTLVEAFEKQIELNKAMTKKIARQKAELRAYKSKKCKERREHLYLVAYKYLKSNNIQGVGRFIIKRHSKICTPEDITNVENEIKQEEAFENVLIFNFQELRK